jgi:hypothetical protein
MIGYYAHHQGAGHLTRMQVIAAELEVLVWGLSSAPKPAGWERGWTALARDDGPRPGAPGRDSDPTAHGVLHWAPLHHDGLARRSEQLSRWVVDHSPRALVVDVSVEVALLGRLCGVPTVVVAMPGQRDDRTHRLAYDSADALLAPWPRGAHGLDWPSHWVDKAWFVGGLSRFDSLTPRAQPVPSGGAPAGRRTVLLLWGAGGRSTSERQVRAAQEATPQWRWVERSPGATPAADLWEELQRADVVVSHAGQNAVAEIAAARRPAVIVAQERPFDEQVATARALERWQIGVGCARWPAPQEWPAILELALSRGGARWSRWSTGHGARDAAGHLAALTGGWLVAS